MGAGDTRRRIREGDTEGMTNYKHVILNDGIKAVWGDDCGENKQERATIRHAQSGRPDVYSIVVVQTQKPARPRH